MKHILKPALSLFIIAVVVTALLAWASNLTAEPIANQLKKTREKTMKEVLPAADIFNKMPVSLTGSITGVYEGKKGNEITGYVIDLAPNGYSGAINMMVGISKNDNAITGMRVVKHSETPGLGALAVTENFYRRYDGKKLVPLRVVKSAPGSNEIEAITGSTITTRAVTGAVNEAIEWFNANQGAVK